MIDVDLTGINSPEELEETAPIEDGFYKAVVASVTQDQKTGALKIHWRIQSPPWVGATLTETVNLPAFCQESSKIKGIRDKLNLFLYRMGLIPKDMLGKPNKIDEQKLVGISRVLQIERKVGKDKPSDSRKFSNVCYGCYYTEDRAEIPGHERIRIGLPLLPGQSAEKPPSAGPTPAPPVVAAGQGVPSPAPAGLAFDPSEV